MKSGCGESLSRGVDSSADVGSSILQTQTIDVERHVAKVEEGADAGAGGDGFAIFHPLNFHGVVRHRVHLRKMFTFFIPYIPNIAENIGRHYVFILNIDFPNDSNPDFNSEEQLRDYVPSIANDPGYTLWEWLQMPATHG